MDEPAGTYRLYRYCIYVYGIRAARNGRCRTYRTYAGPRGAPPKNDVGVVGVVVHRGNYI